MYLYPAIDLVQGKAVRLFKGDYAQMTVYSDNPVSVAKEFQAAGSKHIHLVDLEGAKSGVPENLSTIQAIIAETDLFVEVKIWHKSGRGQGSGPFRGVHALGRQPGGIV